MLHVEVFKQKVQGESISTCTCQQELTWSSEIKCKPSFAIPKTNTYKYLHGRVCACVCVRTQGARTEHQYMCFSTIELTWSSEIKCKPSFAISFLTSMHIRVCIQVCTSVCIFKQKVQGKSISTWISQQANLPEVQRSSVNHHCKIFAPKQMLMCTCMQACACFQTKGAKKRASVHEFLNKWTYLKFRDQV